MLTLTIFVVHSRMFVFPDSLSCLHCIYLCLSEKSDVSVDFVLVHVAYICGLFEKHGRQMSFALGNASYIQDCSLLSGMSYISRCLHWLYSMSVLETWCASLSWTCSNCLYPWSVRVSVFRTYSRNLYSKSIREPGNSLDTVLGQVAYIPDLGLQDRVPLCSGLVHEVYIQGPKW
jgi:hypothetical protein